MTNNDERLMELTQHIGMLDARLDAVNMDLVQTKRTIARLAVILNQIVETSNGQFKDLTDKLEEFTATRH